MPRRAVAEFVRIPGLGGRHRILTNSATRATVLISQRHIHKACEKVSYAADERVVNVLESLAGNQPRDPAHDDAVVVEVRTILGPQAQVGADVLMNAGLKCDLFQRRDLIEPE